ncbi:ABC transporter substrate-binding protein [Thalassoglobus sp.]|uniref:ABC transporter substrate-binding protein n=1 Tax=Thalassoglobus sp. TaxID=2795869 RepID=UPI003AA8AD72
MKVLQFSTCLFILLAAAVHAQPPVEEELPTIDEMVLPTVQQLLNDTEVDWVELNTGGVLTVESVVPRPNTLELRQTEIEELEKVRNKTPANQRDEIAKKLDEMRHLYVSLPDVQGNPEFRVPLKRVVKIIHHEDLMLRRIHKLLEENKIDPALELMNRLRRNWDVWPGMDETHLRIIFVDAKYRIGQGDAATSLMLLDEVYQADKNYPGLRTQSGYAVQQLVEKALADSDYTRAQFYLNWLRQRFSDHDVYNTFSAQLIGKTDELVEQANSASSSGDFKKASELISSAAEIWPLAPSLKGSHRTHTERFQQLKVGVVDLPGKSDAYFALSPADLRKQRLTRLNLFELERLRDGTAYYRTRFFDEWEPTDLGREMRFTLKQFRQPYEMQAVVTTADIVPLLINRLTPSHPAYDERLSSYVESIEVHSPTEFSLSFRRVPPRIEPLLANISVSATDETTLSEDLSDPGGFQVFKQDDGTISYNRKIEQPDGLPKYHIAELIEIRYDSYEKAAQALTRGEISMIPDLPDWIIRRMQSDEEFMKKFFILPYQLPETHLLQFNPASQPVRNRELRTALAYAVDRERLLREVVLRDPRALNGKVVTTPFLSSNPGRNILVEPRRYDLSAALAMLLASRKQLKDGIPPLTMIVAPGPTSEQTAQEIAAVWKKIGIDIKLVYAHEPRPEKWDIIYRSVQMVEPLVDIWPFLTIEERARLDDLRDYPDWLKQELIQLDRTSEQSRAIAALQVLHRHLWSDTAVFPLWELQRYAVIRKNIQGYPKTLMHCYDQIDRWSVDSWYQTELP